jgi:deazaflavin-dependent oxidoreductase (nitroreductase family)
LSREPWYNGLVRWLLRSPLHGLMSRSTLLVTVTGRQSGRAYVVPASYARQDDTVWIVTRGDKTWWRNLRAGARVELQLGGRSVSGFAEVLPLDPDQAAAVSRRVWPGLSPDQARSLAPQAVVIQVGLGQATRAQPERHLA